MIDWRASMQQTFKYYKVDPTTWYNLTLLDEIKSCTIERDLEADTLGSATIECTSMLGECYIRVYLVVIQNGRTYEEALGTFIVQTPGFRFDGKNKTVSADAYTPLLELKNNYPPLGYTVMAGEKVMEKASDLCDEHMHAPVVPASSTKTLYSDFVAETDDTWLSYISDLIAKENYKFSLDAMGRLYFDPKQEVAALQHVWTYDDDNSSILYPDVSGECDLYDVPNVVEVVFSTETTAMFSRAVNDSSASITSTVNRGREVLYRDTNPSLIGNPTQAQLDEYAAQLLKTLSSVEYSITYKHGYCPVRIGDCVLLNYERADLKNIKAKVVSQSIECAPGCPVTETAVYTKRLWGE